jgi:hypothetical protein
MHVALVTMTTEAKPPGTHWWHTAFQLAREYRLNRDPTAPSASIPQATSFNGVSRETPTHAGSQDQDQDDDMEDSSGTTSPMSVSDDAIVEHSDPRPVISSTDEGEERRRIWWLLYIWDRHLALRYNRPLSIKDSESQDVQLPMDDSTWQTSSSPATSPAVINQHRQRGPPSIILGDSIFEILLPLMCILGQIIDMHHVAYHPRVERGLSNPVADAYTSTITQQLVEIEPSVTALGAHHDGASNTGPFRNAILRQHQHLLGCHARFLLQLLYSLLGQASWDKLTLYDRANEYMHTPRFGEVLSRSLLAAESLEALMLAGPIMEFDSMFFGIFFYHGASLPWAVLASLKRQCDPKVVHACETYVRVYEASNTSYLAEYLRKTRRLLLTSLKEIRDGVPLSRTEAHLQKHILKVYRWTGEGTGLGL